MERRPTTTLFMLMSVDGKISPGASDDLDVDKDFPNIIGLKEGLPQYYEIEHVGSTSVVGLPAKPIIDIDAVVKSGDVEKTIRALEHIGYIHEGNLGIEGREAFAYEGKEHLQAHHLYVCPEDSEELKRHLAFREYLRKNQVAREKYGSIKLEAAKLYPDDIEKYIEYKSPIIEEIYANMFCETVVIR